MHQLTLAMVAMVSGRRASRVRVFGVLTGRAVGDGQNRTVRAERHARGRQPRLVPNLSEKNKQTENKKRIDIDRSNTYSAGIKNGRKTHRHLQIRLLRTGHTTN